MTRTRIWPGPVLNQHASAACMGYGWATAILAAPITGKPTTGNALGREIYDYMLNHHDGDPAGAAYVHEHGWSTGVTYLKRFGAVRRALKHGPVVCSLEISVHLTRDHVMRPARDRKWFHCVAIVGYRRRHGRCLYRIRNSYGHGWGDDGEAWITGRDLRTLVRRVTDDRLATAPDWTR